MEVQGELPDMNAEGMAKEGFYLVKSVLATAITRVGASSPSGKGLESKNPPESPFLRLFYLRDAQTQFWFTTCPRTTSVSC